MCESVHLDEDDLLASDGENSIFDEPEGQLAVPEVCFSNIEEGNKLRADIEIKKIVHTINESVERLRIFHETIVSTNVRIGEARDSSMSSFCKEKERVNESLVLLKKMWNQIRGVAYACSQFGWQTDDDIINVMSILQSCSEILHCPQSQITKDLDISEARKRELFDMLSGISVILGLNAVDSNIVNEVKVMVNERNYYKSKMEKLEHELKLANATIQASSHVHKASEMVNRTGASSSKEAMKEEGEQEKYRIIRSLKSRFESSQIRSLHEAGNTRMQCAVQVSPCTRIPNQISQEERSMMLIPPATKRGSFDYGSASKINLGRYSSQQGEFSDVEDREPNTTPLARSVSNFSVNSGIKTNIPEEMSLMKMMLRANAMGPIPKFSGEKKDQTFDDFIKCFELRYPSEVWNDGDRLPLLVENLKGVARDYYDSIPSKKRTGYLLVKASLKDLLDGDIRLRNVESLNTLQTLKFEGSKTSIKSFLMDFERLSENAYSTIDESNKQLLMAQMLSRILLVANWGAADQIQQILEDIRGDKYDRIKEICLRRERISMSKKAAMGVVQKSNTFKEKSYGSVSKNVSLSNTFTSNNIRDTGKAHVKCFTCGKTGHMSKSCWKKNVGGGTENVAGVSGSGVGSRNLPMTGGNASSPPRLTGGNAVPQGKGWIAKEPVARSSMRVQGVTTVDSDTDFFQMLTDGDNDVARCQVMRSELDVKSVLKRSQIVGPRPIVQIEVFDCEVDGLIDTGAQITTISKQFLIDLYKNGIKLGKWCTVLSREQKYRVVDASGNDVKYSMLIKVPVVILPDSCAREIVMYVVDYAPDEPILLGTNALSSLGIEISRRLADGTQVSVTGFCEQPMENLESVSLNKSSVEHSRVMSLRVYSRVVIAPNAVKEVEVSTEDESLFETSALFWSTDESLVESGMLQFTQGVARISVHNASETSLKFDRGDTIGMVDEGVRVASLGEEESYDMLDYCKNRVELSSDVRVRKLLKVIQDKSSTEMPQELVKLIEEFADVFALDDCELKQTNVVAHDIDTGDSKPVRQKPRPVPMGAKSKFREIIEGLLERGIIEKSSSPWASPIVLVQKKDGTIRLCIDYREVNKRIKLDCFPLPRIDDLIQSLAGKKWFTTLDLHSGFWQVGLTEQAKEKSAFTTTEGLFQFKVLPFGLATSPAVFQRLMSMVLSEFDNDSREVQCYIDDVLISTDSLDRHMFLLRKVFMAMRKVNLSLKPSKCSFLKSEVKYLGHVLKGDGVHADPEKVAAIREYPKPTNVSELRSFLGLCSYYRKFVLKFGALAKPLNELTSKGIPWIWDERRENAFCALRDTLCSAPVLIQPDFEGAQKGSNPFILYTDACKFGVGAVLCQRGADEFLHPVYFVSRSLKKAETNYSITDIEALAVVHAIQRLRSYLYDMVVIVRTDHQPLTTFFKVNNSGRVARWALMIQSYNKMTIEYVKGKTNVVADALSRGTQVRAEGDYTPTGGGNQDMVMVAKCQVDNSGDKENSGHKSWLQLLRSDNTFKNVIERLEKGDSEELVKLPRVKEKFSLKDFVISGDFLLFVSQEGDRKKVVPEKLRKSIYDNVHCGQMGGHFAIKKMINILKKHYFWNGLSADVARWHFECKECFLANSRVKSIPPLKPILVGRPYELVGIDLMDMGISSSGNRYILMLVDHFSKWLGAFPIASKNAEIVAETIVTRWICEGARWPKQFLSDQGSEFLNQVIDHIRSLTGINWITTKGYNPRENGLVERANGTIKNILKKKVKLTSDWDKILPFAVYSYNTSVHTTTGESPFFLLHGMDPVLVSSVDLPEYSHWNVENVDEYKTTLMEGIRVAHMQATENAEKESQRVKEFYDKVHHVDVGWYPVVGERVYMKVTEHKKKGPNPKLLCGYSGPYRVLSKTDNSAVIVDIKGKGEPMQIPFDWLLKVPDTLDDEKVGPEVQRGKRGKNKVQLSKITVHEMFCRSDEEWRNAMVGVSEGDVQDLSMTENDPAHPLFVCKGQPIQTQLAQVEFDEPCKLANLGAILNNTKMSDDLRTFVPKNALHLAHAIAWIEEGLAEVVPWDIVCKMIRLPTKSILGADHLARAYSLIASKCDHVLHALESESRIGIAMNIAQWKLRQSDIEKGFYEARARRIRDDILPSVNLTLWPSSFDLVLDRVTLNMEEGNSFIYDGNSLNDKVFGLLAKTKDDRDVKICIATGGAESPVNVKELVERLPTRKSKSEIIFFPVPLGLGDMLSHMQNLNGDWESNSVAAFKKGWTVSKFFMDDLPLFSPLVVLGAKPLDGTRGIRLSQMETYMGSIRALVDKDVGKYKKVNRKRSAAFVSK